MFCYLVVDRTEMMIVAGLYHWLDYNEKCIWAVLKWSITLIMKKHSIPNDVHFSGSYKQREAPLGYKHDNPAVVAYNKNKVQWLYENRRRVP